MPLSATLMRNMGGAGDKTAASPQRSAVDSSSSTIPSLVANNAAPFSATEALQAALTSRYASSALRTSQWQSPPTSGRATAALQAATETQVVMSTIGFGIDLGHGGTSSWDATEASVRALRDAMERSTLRLPYLASLSDAQLQLHVKLGVPPKSAFHPTEPMVVDMAAVTAVLPRSIPLNLPIQVVVGGLAVPGVEGGEPPICAAIASVSIQTVPDSTGPAQAAMEPWSQLASEEVEQKNPPVKGVAQPSNNPSPGRVDSMSMLARISSAVMDNPNIVSGTGSDHFAAAVAAVRGMNSTDGHKYSLDLTATGTEEDTSTSASSSQGDRSPTNRKRRADLLPKPKLRPGLTGKKNSRQFVQHNYHDHAHDVPLPGESATGPLGGGDNIAFPFKMHDILTRIDAEGYSDIMSWMPHGRSFKIHDQDGFEEHILPLYFRHSKKSSLLRQLNLYGFRRICAGPDKGSYYHELFLRGKRFLCGRMRRVKVNGKRIRSAGNPETEPIFSQMEPLSLTSEPIINIHTISSDVSEDEDEEVAYMEQDASVEASEVPDGPVPYNALSFPFKLHALLDLLEVKGETSVISWLPHGRAFRVQNPNAFVQILMPRYFNMSKFSSFQRQLSLYGYLRVTNGADKGSYYHPSFLRGMPQLCRDMKRTVVNGKGVRTRPDPSQHPEFYSMPPIPSIDPSFLELPLEMPEVPPMNVLAAQEF